jgi:hypothetical protein
MHADARKSTKADGWLGNGWVTVRVVAKELQRVAKGCRAPLGTGESEREKKKAPALESVRALSV